MPVNKKLLTQRFDAACETYDEVAFVQRQAAVFLQQQLRTCWPDFYPQQVLDIGAGSGYLTECLLPHFPGSDFMLYDLSAKMLRCAQKRLNPAASITYHCNDFDHLKFHEVDLLVSNLALQWSAQLEDTLRAGYLTSKRFAFSGLLAGTFSTWDDLFKALSLPSPVRSYWSQAQWESVLLALKPQQHAFSTQTLTVCFDNAHAVMRYLHRLGAALGLQALSVAELRRVIKHQQAPIELNYHLFFGLLVRSE